MASGRPDFEVAGKSARAGCVLPGGRRCRSGSVFREPCLRQGRRRRRAGSRCFVGACSRCFVGCPGLLYGQSPAWRRRSHGGGDRYRSGRIPAISRSRRTASSPTSLIQVQARSPCLTRPITGCPGPSRSRRGRPSPSRSRLTAGPPMSASTTREARCISSRSSTPLPAP